MAFPISPGVFLQDNCCPPEWLGKGVVLFVGLFAKGPVGVPVSVKTAFQAELIFGVDDGTFVTAAALRQFFEQGGRTAKVLRVGIGHPTPAHLRAGDNSRVQVLPAEDLAADLIAGQVGAGAEKGGSGGTGQSDFDPGPDQILPGQAGWEQALATQMKAPWGTSEDGLSVLRELAPGRVEMMAAPVLASLPAAEARAIYRKLHALCVEKDIFLLLDPPTCADIPADRWFDGFGLGRSQHAVALGNLLTEGQAPARVLPPSGAVAGLLDRVARQRGVWAPVTGKRCSLTGMGVVPGGLDPRAARRNINVLRDLGEGVVLPPDGVFSRAGHDAPRLRVLRLLRKTRLTLRAELVRLMVARDVDSRRSEARLIAEALMTQLWADGALKGAKPSEAFRVSTTKPAPDSDLFELCVGLALQSAGKFHWETIKVDARGQ
ncbi:hypothetical protein [Aliiroseovarius crassostreae]|uniref:hypothetical protein n=1 Tax=Aliiroseovarius crassostreae TaxID=154981 RepID=UPI00220956A8|nr:hypothetical protein [Aliiroseovarius crassostreae]UWQ08415.1 hypothetical protein K3X25_02110 [Aliiroseovarius crassostreae]